MTVRGKISSLRQNFKIFGELFECLISLWQKFEPTLGKFYAIG